MLNKRNLMEEKKKQKILSKQKELEEQIKKHKK